MADAPLLTRLTAQLKGRRDMALSILMDRGHMTADGQLTVLGQVRQDMGPDGRAKERAARYAGRSPDEYRYDPRTNRATLR